MQRSLQKQSLLMDAYALPDSLGTFDIALVGSLLLHTRAPLQILEQTIVVTDMFFPDLEGSPVCRIHGRRSPRYQ
jgi:hypothetical protein